MVEVYTVFYFAVLFAYPISVYALIRWYHRRRMSNDEHSIWIPIACMPILACIWSYLTVGLYLNALGPGALMMLCSVPFTLVSLILHFLDGRNSQKVKNDVPAVQWWVRILVVILIICMSIAPFAGFRAIDSGCYKLHAKIAEPIIAALHAYEADNGEYPRDLEALVPQYLETIPQPVCLYLNPFFARFWSDDNEQYDIRHYHLEWCQIQDRDTYQIIGERPILTLQNVVWGFAHQYNLQTGEWSRVDNFDGTCNYLD